MLARAAPGARVASVAKFELGSRQLQSSNQGPAASSPASIAFKVRSKDRKVTV